MKLLTATDPMLRQVCDRGVITFDQIGDMFRLMREHKGIGLAAPQVGINARVFVTGWGQVFFDPVIVTRLGWVWSDEGCLSIPGLTVQVPRHTGIRLGSNEWFHGLKAFVIQHELDHLNGKLITDRVSRDTKRLVSA